MKKGAFEIHSNWTAAQAAYFWPNAAWVRDSSNWARFLCLKLNRYQHRTKFVPCNHGYCGYSLFTAVTCDHQRQCFIQAVRLVALTQRHMKVPLDWQKLKKQLVCVCVCEVFGCCKSQTPSNKQEAQRDFIHFHSPFFTECWPNLIHTWRNFNILVWACSDPLGTSWYRWALFEHPSSKSHLNLLIVIVALFLPWLLTST